MERIELVKEALREAGPRARPSDPLHAIRSPFPLQRPNFYYPGLDTRAFHDKARFPWTAELDAAAPAIRAELDELLASRDGFIRVFEDNTGEGEWGAYILHLYGRRLDANAARCPRTVALLDRIPGLCGLVCFSALAPQTHVLPHCGPSNVRLRCHLPLVVPGACRLRVANRTIEWREGESIVFDDSFEHEAWNGAEATRIVLMFDILHPGLTAEERELCYVLQDQEAKEQYARTLLSNASPAGDWVYG